MIDLRKPWQKENRQPEPSPAEKKRLLTEMFEEQRGICYLSEKRMTLETGHPNSAVIEHVSPGKMGGCKDWSRSNLRAATWEANQKKGSSRTVARNLAESAPAAAEGPEVSKGE